MAGIDDDDGQSSTTRLICSRRAWHSHPENRKSWIRGEVPLGCKLVRKPDGSGEVLERLDTKKKGAWLLVNGERIGRHDNNKVITGRITKNWATKKLIK